MPTPHGRISLVSLILLLAVAGGLYSVVIFGPIYADEFDVRHAVSTVHTQLPKLRDEQARALLREKLRYVGSHTKLDRFGNAEVAQGLGLTDEQIEIIRDEVHETSTIRVSYQREVQLRPLDRWVVLEFTPTRTGHLERP